MEFLRYLLRIQYSKIISILLILIFAVSVVSADVSISHAYYTNNAECREDVFLHNMDYSNSVSIFSDSFGASSESSLPAQSNDGKIETNILLKSNEGLQGVGLKITDAKDLGFSRSLSGGKSNSIGLSYYADSGHSNANYFNRFASYAEDISLFNNKYEERLGVFGSQSYSSGKGESTADTPSSFKHSIYMSYLNNYCKTDSFLNAFGENSGMIPLSYTWKGYSIQKDYAVAGMQISIDQSNDMNNRDPQYAIAGSSSGLSGKYSPDEWKPSKAGEKGIPADLDPNTPLIDPTAPTYLLYMQYKMSQNEII